MIPCNFKEDLLIKFLSSEAEEEEEGERKVQSAK